MKHGVANRKSNQASKGKLMPLVANTCSWPPTSSTDGKKEKERKRKRESERRTEKGRDGEKERDTETNQSE